MPMMPSGLPEIVANEETLVRFVFTSNHYNAQGVKWQAIMPDPANDETSVFRSYAGVPDDLWQQGLRIAGERTLTLHGAGCLSAALVLQASLAIKSVEPPPKHANIVGWPTIVGDPAMQKSARMELAKRLINDAISVRYNLNADSG